MEVASGARPPARQGWRPPERPRALLGQFSTSRNKLAGSRRDPTRAANLYSCGRGPAEFALMFGASRRTHVGVVAVGNAQSMDIKR